MRRLFALIAALCALASCLPAFAAIGTPVYLGKATAYNSTITSLAATTGANSAASNTIVVEGVAYSPSAAFTVTVTDSASNTYVVQQELYDTSGGGSGYTFIAWCVSCSALASSGTITLHFSVSQAYYTTFGASTVSGPTAVDVNGTGASGSSTSPAYTTGGLAQAGEIAFGVTGWHSGAAYTEAAAFTNLLNDTADTGPVDSLAFGYAPNVGASAVSYAPSLASSAAWGANVVTFKGAAPPPSACRRLLLGVGC